MRRLDRPWFRYLYAVLIVLAAMVLRVQFLSVLGTRLAYITFYPAVMLAALFGGVGPGLCATALSGFLALYFVIEPRRELSIHDPAELIGLGIFALSCTMISAICEVLQRSRKRAAAAGAAAQDLRDRQQTQDQLRLYESLVRHSRDIILFMRRDDGRLLEANDAAVKAYGYGREELLQKRIHDLRAVQTRDVADHQMQVALAQGVLFETLHQRKDGSTFPVEVSSQGTPIGESPTLISVVRDITERKREEEAFRESKERLDLALHSADMGIWELDLTSQARRFDERVCLCLGIDPAKFRGTAEEFYRTVHPDDRAALKAALDRTIENGVPYEEEYRVVWPNGSVHHLATRGRLKRDQQGKPQRISGLIWDITGRKQAEGALRESEERFRVAQELSPDGFTILRPMCDEAGLIIDFTWVYQNPAVARLTGTDPQEVLGKRLLELFPGHRGSKFFEVYKQVEEIID